MKNTIWEEDNLLLKEGTWACPYKAEEANVLLNVMKNPIDPKVAQKLLWNIYGDDMFMDDIDMLIDSGATDARFAIKKAINCLVGSIEDGSEFSDHDEKDNSWKVVWNPKVVEILKKVANYDLTKESKSSEV